MRKRHACELGNRVKILHNVFHYLHIFSFCITGIIISRFFIFNGAIIHVLQLR